MKATPFSEKMGIEAPLVGFNRSPQVVAEVSRAGGLGVLAITPYTPTQLDAQLTWIEEQLDGRPYGVDLLLPEKAVVGDPEDYLKSLRAMIPDEHVRFIEHLIEKYEIPDRPIVASAEIWTSSLSPAGVEELIQVALEHPVALIASALGTPPASMLDGAHKKGIPVAALVGARKHAERQLERGVDVLVAQGTEAGGHTGEVTSMVLTPEIVDLAGDVPVLAAGGIASGRQMAAALSLGASGVWCGSAWLSSAEDITPMSIKKKFLAASSSDTVRSRARTGKPARQLKSAWHEEWDDPKNPDPLPMPLQPLLVRDVWEKIDAAAEEGLPGALQLASWHVGQVVGSFAELRSTADIAQSIISECEATLSRLADLR